MKKVKKLIFNIDDRWSKNEVWQADTIFGWYTIFKEKNATYKEKFGYRLSCLSGRGFIKKSFDEVVKLAQKDWEDRLSKIEDCYETEDVCAK